MVNGETNAGASGLTPVQWLICGIAAFGFAFDSYELLMSPLIVRPALAELLGVPGDSLAVNTWVGSMEFVPAAAGGIFGLLGGYLTDLFGRRRVLVWSILLYAVSSLQEVGGLTGRIVLAALAPIIISRRRLLHVFQLPGLMLLPTVFFLTPTMGLSMAQWGILLLGLTTIAQFSFWGNYAAAIVGTSACVIGVIASFWLPEPRATSLSD
jgi:MFS family permease